MLKTEVYLSPFRYYDVRVWLCVMSGLASGAAWRRWKYYTGPVLRSQQIRGRL